MCNVVERRLFIICRLISIELSGLPLLIEKHIIAMIVVLCGCKLKHSVSLKCDSGVRDCCLLACVMT